MVKLVGALVGLMAVALLVSLDVGQASEIVALIAFAMLVLLVVLFYVAVPLHALLSAARRVRHRGDDVRVAEADDLAQRAWESVCERDDERAAALYRQAAQLGDERAMINLGIVLGDHLDEPAEAERCFERAIEAGAGIAALYLGQVRLEQGRTQDAQQLFERAVRLKKPGGYRGLARIAEDRGDPAQARELLEVAILDGDLDAYAPLGEVLAQLGRDATAETWLREGIDNNAPGAAAALADLLHATGREDEAGALAERIQRDEDAWPP